VPCLLWSSLLYFSVECYPSHCSLGMTLVRYTLWLCIPKDSDSARRRRVNPYIIATAYFCNMSVNIVFIAACTFRRSFFLYFVVNFVFHIAFMYAICCAHLIHF
jgi:hypothetical protein